MTLLNAFYVIYARAWVSVCNKAMPQASRVTGAMPQASRGMVLLDHDAISRSALQGCGWCWFTGVRLLLALPADKAKQSEPNARQSKASRVMVLLDHDAILRSTGQGLLRERSERGGHEVQSTRRVAAGAVRHYKNDSWRCPTVKG